MQMADQPLIRNYGLFWKTEDVFWGAGRQPGKLNGVLSTNVTNDPIDFRDQRGIYVLYAGYDLVYVGQNNSQELLARLKQHKKDDLADRWDRFSWFGLRTVKANGELAQYNQAVHASNRNVLNHIEAILIHSSEPRLNRQGGKFGDDIERYLQVRDHRLGPLRDKMLRKIYDNLPN
jgi:hypothetical protein